MPCRRCGARGGGSIINIASQLGHLGVPLRSPYCTTKAALIHFTRILAMDHAVDNIRANTISPGFILTERSSRRSGGKEQARAINGPQAFAQQAGRAETKSPPVRSISPPTTPRLSRRPIS
jgi:NAD(P)-dependent dehydrogenase (short-subunit alcohol dehydrogenase family)